jgi:hypothetical protein
MNLQPKLRMSVGLWYPIVIFSCYIIAIIEWGIRKGLIADGIDIIKFPFFTYFIAGTFFIVMGVFQWFKYRLWTNPVLGILIGVLCFLGPFAITGSAFFFKGTYFIILIIMVLFVIFNWSAFYGQERYEINSRRLFRLAVERIQKTSDGFTYRPYFVGEIGVSLEELRGFLRFMEGKYITRIFMEENCAFLAFSLNKSLFSVKNPREVSYISISGDGAMTVFVSEADYRQYRRAYNFDQLCQSLGEVFKRFYQYYHQGLESRIIMELKSSR